jgi:hypothetical protein
MLLRFLRLFMLQRLPKLWQQFNEFIFRLVGYLVQHIIQPFSRIDVLKLTGCHKAVYYGSQFTTSGQEIVRLTSPLASNNPYLNSWHFVKNLKLIHLFNHLSNGRK